MDYNLTGILPLRVTSHDVEGSSKVSKPKKNKEPTVKLKPVEEEVVKQIVPTKTAKGVLKRTKKTKTKKQFESDSTKPTKNPVETQAEKFAKGIPTPMSETITQECETVGKKGFQRRLRSCSLQGGVF